MSEPILPNDLLVGQPASAGYLYAQARAIAAYSIVRLPDGRIGYLHKNTGMRTEYWVITNPGMNGVCIDWQDRLEIIHTPQDLATIWTQRYLAWQALQVCPDVDGGSDETEAQAL
jgi:hypothetical protein